jgi:DNA polymerase-1
MALLIDADIIAMHAVAACQREVEFETDEWQLYCDLNDVRPKFKEKIDELMEATTQTDYLLCWSDPEKGNFRKQLNPEYKANRTARKPVGYWPFVRGIHETEKKRCRYRPRLEADDVMGILATRDIGKHVIWSIDKDMMQIPGPHLIDGVEVDQDADLAELTFLSQVLTGDTVDNYPGCPGVGPVGAEKILAKVTLNANPASYWADVWQAILNAYAAKGLTEADALLQARMAYLLRHDNYNNDTGKIRLWKPAT